MSVQWFRKRQPITDEIYDTMYQETSGIIERLITVWENVQLEYIKLSDTEKSTFSLTPEFITNDSIESNPLLGIYAKQTLNSDILSAADINDAGVGEKGSILKDNTDRTIHEFRSSSNPLIAQNVFSRTKRNLLEDGDTYSDEYILENTNTVVNLKSSRNRTEDESVEVGIKRVRKNKKQLINTKAIEHNNNVHMGNISNIDLNKF